MVPKLHRHWFFPWKIVWKIWINTWTVLTTMYCCTRTLCFCLESVFRVLTVRESSQYFLGINKKDNTKIFSFLALPNRMRDGWFEPVAQKCSIDDKSKFVSNKRIGRFNFNFNVWPPGWTKHLFFFLNGYKKDEIFT